jgi:hypothetical protein
MFDPGANGLLKVDKKAGVAGRLLRPLASRPFWARIWRWLRAMFARLVGRS